MNDRAVSSALNYVLSISIAAVLVTGLLFAGGNFVDDRREQVIRGELDVIGQQVASDLQRADRLARAGNRTSATEVRLEQRLPNRVTGSTYNVILDGSTETLTLKSAQPSVTVEVHVRTGLDLKDSTAGGGTVSVVVEKSGDELEVRNV